MGIPRFSATLLLMCSLSGTSAYASPLKLPTQRAEVKLAYGLNNVKVGAMALNIVRAQVGTLSASSFDTFTVFLLPPKAEDAWMHVTAPASKGIGYNLRNYEAGDANTQAIAFYRDANHLYAVQATKAGPDADANGPRKTLFDFKVFVFNENEEVPMFDNEASMHSKGRYVDAREALQREFFKP